MEIVPVILSSTVVGTPGWEKSEVWVPIISWDPVALAKRPLPPVKASCPRMAKIPTGAGAWMTEDVPS